MSLFRRSTLKRQAQRQTDEANNAFSRALDTVAVEHGAPRFCRESDLEVLIRLTKTCAEPLVEFSSCVSAKADVERIVEGLFPAAMALFAQLGSETAKELGLENNSATAHMISTYAKIATETWKLNMLATTGGVGQP